ncbi:hypothetical protein DV736_g5125, partial [Chaetothyriales sp. CBS 134916]
MGTKARVFVIGPGFIGHNIVELLVEEGYNVTALTRREPHADAIRKSGATAVMGQLSDFDIIQEQTSNSDIIFQVATGDNLPLEEAILRGVRARANQGKRAIYVHTSGAKVFDDGAKGMFKSDKIYYDDKREDMDSVSDDAPHRDVDLALVHAQEELQEHLRLAIMLPPEVYGYDSKHDRLSITIPNLTRFAIKHGYAPVIGDGSSVETQVNVMDLARGYVTVMHFLEDADQKEVLANPYWLCENGEEFSWRESADVIGQALSKAGQITSPAPRNPPKEQYPELCGQRTESYMGLNCRARAVRLRKLGWEPREKSIWESYLQDELPVILKRAEENKS